MPEKPVDAVEEELRETKAELARLKALRENGRPRIRFGGDPAPVRHYTGRVPMTSAPKPAAGPKKP